MVDAGSPESRSVTRMLRDLSAGHRDVLDQLMPLVYDQLRNLAGRILAEQRAGHTLQPTALVNDAYVKLVGADADYDSRRHFYGVAARAMRSILADHARGRARQKRGGDWRRVTLAERADTSGADTVDVIALDQALDQLAQVSSDYSRVVELRFFAGLSLDEIAAHTGLSRSTVKNHWRTARAWLKVRLNPAG